MLMMNEEYARSRDEKAERVMDWLVSGFKIKPFTTPKITRMDMEAVEAIARPETRIAYEETIPMTPTTTEATAETLEIEDLFEQADQEPCTCNVNENVCRHCLRWETARAALRLALSRTPPPPSDEVRLLREALRLAYKTGHNEGYIDATDDGTGNGYPDHNAAEEGWQQYQEKLDA